MREHIWGTIHAAPMLLMLRGSRQWKGHWGMVVCILGGDGWVW
jgi:hypothetical protein